MLARAASSASAASRASRAAALASARAARAAAAARRAAAAVSRAARSSTDAAATDLASAASSFRCDASTSGRLLGGARGAAPRLPLDSDSLHNYSWVSPDQPPEAPKVEFVADEKDLESDEALWALYERWCKHFNEERDRDEMARRFNKFKEMVLYVHQENNSDRPYKLEINQLSDGKLLEVCCTGMNAAPVRQGRARMTKLPKSDSWFVYADGKYYMELPAECQPESIYHY